MFKKVCIFEKCKFVETWYLSLTRFHQIIILSSWSIPEFETLVLFRQNGFMSSANFGLCQNLTVYRNEILIIWLFQNFAYGCYGGIILLFIHMFRLRESEGQVSDHIEMPQVLFLFPSEKQEGGGWGFCKGKSLYFCFVLKLVSLLGK